MFREIPNYSDYYEIIQHGLSATFRCPVAICAQTARLSSVVCRLELVFDPAVPSGFFHEIAFEMEVICLDGSSESFSTHNSGVAQGYLPATTRASIIPLVREGYERLVRLIDPRVIYRVMQAPASCVKALSKHLALTEHLQALGYDVVETGTDLRSRRFWLMERRNN